MPRKTFETVAGAAFFVAFIAAHFLLGISAAVRVAGAACVAAGLVWVVGRSVPVGVEDRPPSFFIRGAGAMVAGIAIAALGVTFLLFPRQTACILGWATGTECF